jgi:ABC-type multidrug transport system fused ATPase/permease subunit
MNDESLQIDIPDHYDYRHPYSVIALAVGVSLIPFVGLVVGWSEHALGFILGSVPGFSLVSFFHKLFGLLTILLFFAGYVVLIIMNFSAIRRISKLIRDSKALEDETNRVKEELEKQGITIRLDPVCYLDSGRRLGLAEARGIGPYYIGLDASHLDNQELLIVPISHEISHLISGDQFILYSLLATGTGRLRGLANVYGILLRPWRYFSELSADRLMLLACGDIETVAEYFAEFFPNPEGDTGSELLAKARQYPKQINLMEIFQSHPSPVRRLQQLNDWGATYADQTR